jgi:hypothetical protein
MLSIVVLTDYLHDRNKDDVERVVMHPRVSLNSYNINAQVNYKVMTVIKQKTLMGRYAPVLVLAQKEGYTPCCFAKVGPQSSYLSSSCSKSMMTPNTECGAQIKE